MLEASAAASRRRPRPRRDPVSGRHLELRQLRYFVTLAEELHFGQAAAREHIVRSALSQQIRRLDRALGVQLVRRTTHHVELTAAVRAGCALPTLRVGMAGDAYGPAREVVQNLLEQRPEVEITQVESR